MHDISSRAIGAKAFVLARLSEMESALDGFPAAVLLDDCLTLHEKDGVVDRRAQWLVEHILTQWTTTIERDLERFPPATILVLQTIRQRMVDARDALLRLRSLLHELSESAPNRAEPNEYSPTPRSGQVVRVSVMRPRTGARRSDSDPSDALCQFERDAVLQGNTGRAASLAHLPAMAAPQPPAGRTEGARP